MKAIAIILLGCLVLGGCSKEPEHVDYFAFQNAIMDEDAVRKDCESVRARLIVEPTRELWRDWDDLRFRYVLQVGKVYELRDVSLGRNHTLKEQREWISVMMNDDCMREPSLSQ